MFPLLTVYVSVYNNYCVFLFLGGHNQNYLGYIYYAIVVLLMAIGDSCQNKRLYLPPDRFPFVVIRAVVDGSVFSINKTHVWH